MALRFVRASSQQLNNTTGLDLTNCTIIMAVKTPSGSSAYNDTGGIFSLNDGSGHYLDIMFADFSGYTDIRVENDGAPGIAYELTGAQLDAWIVVSVTRNGTAVTMKVSLENSGSWVDQQSDTATGAGPYTASNVRVGQEIRNGRYSNVDVHFIKVWSGILTATQQLDETEQNTPIITSGFNRWFEMEGANLAAHLDDDGPNGYDWTASNTPTVVSNSSIPMGGGGGTQSYSYTAVGGITMSGAAAQLRKAARVPAGGLTMSGAAAQIRKRTKSGAGGLLLSGAASVTSSGTQQRVVTASGGLTLSGAAAQVRKTTKPVAGGVLLSGAAAVATHSSTRTVAASGGLQLGGAAAYSNFTAGGTSGSRKNTMGIPIRIGI